MTASSLRLVEHRQSVHFVDPFDADAPGFTRHWWLGHAGSADDQARALFSFMDGDEEVARASVDVGARVDGDGYDRLSGVIVVHDIDFFEVASHRRREGVGRAAIMLLGAHYPATVLIAFSEEADAFWANIGWELHPRTDRSDMYRPLFARHPE